jgi:two-component system sensor histidine kinase KdpD
MEKDCRPDPDQLLKRLTHEEKVASSNRGHLKIILGAAAGVGKTYQMLEEAQQLKKSGVDVVVALVETHGRHETEVLLDGLEVIARCRLNRGGLEIEDMDLDGVLVRRPAIALVDELAHANAPHLRHARRYQDVEELLDAGISVYTTLNVQHIESLNDIIFQITGVRVRETLPDRIIELADEIEVVDLTPEDLLQRFKDGKVYVPSQAEQAMQRFFRKGNLLGLREIALRYAARMVDEDMRTYMEGHGILGPWPAGSRLLVCINASTFSERLIRIGQRMAADQDAEWFAVYEESPEDVSSSETARDQLARNLTLARELGAKVQVLSARNIAEEVIAFSREHNITAIIVGLPRRRLWNRWWRGSVVNGIIKRSGLIHVLVIGSAQVDQAEQAEPEAASLTSDMNWRHLSGNVLIVAATVAFCWPLQSWLSLINIAMILLLPVIYSGMTWGRRSGLITSLLAVAALDFFFVPPSMTLAVDDLRYLPVFIVFVIVGIITSFLADLVRWQGESARQRERFVSALYSFSRNLMAAGNGQELLNSAAREIAQAFECEVMILLPDETGRLKEQAKMGEHLILDERKLGVATWVFRHGLEAGHGTQTLSSATLSYLPLKTKEVTIGVLGVGLGKVEQLLQPEKKRLLEAFTNILALALDRRNELVVHEDANKKPTKTLIS